LSAAAIAAIRKMKSAVRDIFNKFINLLVQLII